ncbi:putative ABC transporter permease [Bifidobacterium margollesii]|uniref:putative ABC transporter permease n=1 Tax=Bifidobacterium margollesii TaxID=2020964 RepID=UPI003C2B86ED
MALLLEKLFLWGVLYSFIGWVYETILVSAQERRFVNRGFLNGPLCPIYGAGAVLGIVLLTPLQGYPVTIFFLGAIGACLLEYVTSWTMEKLFHARWWDYSNFRFNLNGRICLLGAVVFGIGGLVVLEITQPVVVRITDLLPQQWLHLAAGVLIVLIGVDLTITVVGFSGFYERLADFAADLRQTAGDLKQTASGAAGRLKRDGAAMVPDAVSNAMTGAVGTLHTVAGNAGNRIRGMSGLPISTANRMYEKLTDVLSDQQKRMIRSFPHLRANGYTDIIVQLRERLVSGQSNSSGQSSPDGRSDLNGRASSDDSDPR